MLQSYKTLFDYGTDQMIEKKSRFIGYAKPVTTEKEAIDFINEIKKKHYDATHNCSAYSLREGQIKRFSDDGEPQGTAGIPMLDVLLKSEIVDAVVVVTRYFGGTLLGTGGLVRAYSHSAKIAIESAKVAVMQEMCLCTIKCDYNQYGKISTILPDANCIIDDTEFLENITVKFHLLESYIAPLEEKLSEATCGTVYVKVLDKGFYLNVD